MEGLTGFVAGGEGYVLEMAGGIGDLGGGVLVGLEVFARVAWGVKGVGVHVHRFLWLGLAIALASFRGGAVTYMVLFKQLTGIISPGLYPRASSALFMGSCPLNAAAKDENNAMTGSHDGDFRCNIMAIMIYRRLKESLSACVVGAARKAAATVEVHVSTWTLLSTDRGPWPVPARGKDTPGATPQSKLHLRDMAVKTKKMQICFTYRGMCSVRASKGPIEVKLYKATSWS